jgi:hypothetical protein
MHVSPIFVTFLLSAGRLKICRDNASPAKTANVPQHPVRKAFISAVREGFRFDFILALTRCTGELYILIVGSLMIFASEMKCLFILKGYQRRFASKPGTFVQQFRDLHHPDGFGSRH